MRNSNQKSDSNHNHEWKAASTSPAEAGSQGYPVVCRLCGQTAYQAAMWGFGGRAVHGFYPVGEPVLDI